VALAKLDARDVRVDPLLSSISVAFRNKIYIASQVAPMIPSTLDAGKYAVYNQPDWFRNEARKRSAGARAQRGDLGITFDSYLCEEVAFAREVPDEIRRNAMDPIRPDTDATEYATDKVMLAKEVRVAAKFNTTANWANSTTLSGVNQWNDYANSDPITNVENAIDAIHGATGIRANTISIPYLVWKKLKHHPDIVDRIKYSQRGLVSVELLGEIFEIERILIAEAIYTASNEGVAAGAETYQYVWGKNVWVGYVAPNPGLQQPTAMYQFSSGARGVRRWREEPEHQDVVEAFELVDEKIVSRILGYVIANAVA
jgi:hypothetical protein